MKVAGKVILLFRDPSGFGTAIFEALQPNPNSNLQKREESFDLSLERYGIKDHNASGQVVHFLDDQGLYQVTLLLLENYEPPTISCAINEVLALLAGNGSSAMPTILAPFVVSASKLKTETKTSVATDTVSVYGLQLGPSTDLTQALVTKLKSPPPTLQIFHEQLACLLQLVRILKVPTLVLIGRTGQNLRRKTSEEELEVIHEIGEHIASFSSLCFSGEKIALEVTKSSKESEKPWRALYG